MPRKKLDEAARVVQYFETAPPPAAFDVLAICTAIVSRRMMGPPPAPRRRKTKVNNDPAVTDHNGILLDVRARDPHA